MDTNARTRLRRTTFILTCSSALVVSPLAATAGTTSLPSSVVASTISTVTATVEDGVTHDQNPRVPEGASWTEHYFPSSDGSDVELHADVLRLPTSRPTPPRR